MNWNTYIIHCNSSLWLYKRKNTTKLVYRSVEFPEKSFHNNFFFGYMNKSRFTKWCMEKTWYDLLSF